MIYDRLLRNKSRKIHGWEISGLVVVVFVVVIVSGSAKNIETVKSRINAVIVAFLDPSPMCKTIIQSPFDCYF